ncbi:MetQ/NlpA family ABC transporter substrate-binding protein [Amycolatopsis endophytica]|uniref:D-methionine transport system substrate-binding protein n=1 Tax=Amycolatopsis endophytica TaxID=860233 RepID=A0A853BDQ3_9PSEU|nr:MetQ/NlpA family ABC transporter substrate-binding protein [Amycolatopsis endophytica]NYI93379.1 D-methionine transport system substrate-binding protein [Amycolatopsis endophytica]
MSENISDDAVLPEKPRKKRGPLIGVTLAVVVVLVAVVLVVVNATSDSGTTAGHTTVKIGVTDASSDYWTTFRRIAADNGIDLELVNFSDYTQANPALAQGQLDVNLFQHLLFLANYNVSADQTLTPIGSTYVVPLSLYSRKHNAVAGIPQGGQVAIPNDPTNQARALLVLQSAGLISLRGGGTVLSTPAEIDQAASKVTVTPVDASQTVAALPSVDAAIVNNNFALDADLDPTSALFNDDPASPSAEPYINTFVTRATDKDNPTYLKLAELYRDPRVATEVQAESKGTSVLVSRPGAELQSILGRLEETVRAAKQ